MEFTNFYNIKTEQVGGWTPPPGAHLTAMQTVNPFMHLAARAAIPGLVTTNVPATTTQTKEEKVERQQEHATNTVHIVQVPALHQQQAHHVQPANDTAFPGAAPIRHNATIQQRQPQQAHIIQPTQYTIKQQAGTEQIHIKTAYTTIPQKEKPPKERLYKCGDCEKAFMREEHLKRHTLVHTGHPMHRCEVPGCNKTYTRKDLLTNHLKYIHLGVQPDRPFLCIDCGKDFVRRDHLQRHRKNVHGTGPMVAQMIAAAPGGAVVQAAPPAAAAAAAAPATVQHVTITPEKPKRRFLCVICGKDFNRKDHLQRHQKNVHHQGPGQNPPATVAVSVELPPSSTATATLAPHQTAMSIAN